MPLISIPEKFYKCKDEKEILWVFPIMNHNEYLGHISVKSPTEMLADNAFPPSSPINTNNQELESEPFYLRNRTLDKHLI